MKAVFLSLFPPLRTNPCHFDFSLWVTNSILSLGFFGFFGQLFMTKAFQNAEAHMVAPFKYVEVIFTLLFGVFVLFETYSFYHLLGTFLVVFSLVLNVLYKSRLNKKATKKR